MAGLHSLGNAEVMAVCQFLPTDDIASLLRLDKELSHNVRHNALLFCELLHRNLGSRMAEHWRAHRASPPSETFARHHEAAMLCGTTSRVDDVESQDFPTHHPGGRVYSGLHLGETASHLRCLTVRGRVAVLHNAPLADGAGKHMRQAMFHTSNITCSHLMPRTSIALTGAQTGRLLRIEFPLTL